MAAPSPADPAEHAALHAPLQPAKAPEAAVVVGDDDIRFTRAPRAYRVRGLARNRRPSP